MVPDAITESLELEKGSGDVAVNSLPMDSLPVLATRPNLIVEDAPGTQVQYLGFNLRDPLLKDARVRQAIACAIDRRLIIQTLLGGHAHTAESLLPVNHWAFTGDVARYDYDPARAVRLLDEAGHAPGRDGVRFHLAMKTSTDGDTRLLAAVLQQQLAKVGIALDLRSYEFATFYSDVTRGAFQMYSLRWIGNEQPDIFSVYSQQQIFLPKAPTAATTRIRSSMPCSTMRARARTRLGGAPITSRRNRFWRAICPPSTSGTGIRSWCTTGG